MVSGRSSFQKGKGKPMMIGRTYYVALHKGPGPKVAAIGEGLMYFDKPEDVAHELSVWGNDPGDYEIVTAKLVVVPPGTVDATRRRKLPVVPVVAEDLDGLHDLCRDNKAAVERSRRCGCFHCLRTFPASEVKEWIDRMSGETALCPHCRIDSVLPGSETTISKATLRRMHARWFSYVVPASTPCGRCGKPTDGKAYEWRGRWACGSCYPPVREARAKKPNKRKRRRKA